jgi:hypothetical protein
MNGVLAMVTMLTLVSTMKASVTLLLFDMLLFLVDSLVVALLLVLDFFFFEFPLCDFWLDLLRLDVGEKVGSFSESLCDDMVGM